MLNKKILGFKKHWPVLILTVLLGLILFSNFPFGEWLTGWDNLHPEFDFSLNFWRAIIGVWQGHQGLGHLGGHGYVATLLHTAFLWILSFVFPLHSLRAVFTFVMLFSGVIGAYFLSWYLFKDKPFRAWGALVVGLFYLVNLSTVQQFYFQFEPFIIFYGLLPWSWLVVQQFLTAGGKWRLLWLFGVHLLLSPIGFLPPLFVVYSLSLGLLSIGVLGRSFSWNLLKRVVMVLVVLVVTNAYWLLPVGYYTLTQSHDYLNSLNNQLSTPGFHLQAKAYGGLKEVGLLQGFVWDAKDTDPQTEESVYALEPWRNHFDEGLAPTLGIVVFGLAVFGFFMSVLKGSGYWLGLSLWGFVGFTTLAQRVFPFSVLGDFFQEIPVLDQAFRVAFTKVSIPLSLVYGLWLGFALVWLLTLLSRRLVNRVFLSVLLVASLVYLGWPLVEGNMFYPRLKQEIPEEYFQLFAFMESQPEFERVAVFPLTDNYGWHQYEWGYVGSGFLWYGMNQPILDRSFDSWSRYNEAFYLESITAMDNKDATALNRVFDKYDVSWVVLDEGLLVQKDSRRKQLMQESRNLIAAIPGSYLAQTFGDVEVYFVGEEPQVSVLDSASEVTVNGSYLREDVVYEHLGNYVDSPGTTFPFTSVKSARFLDTVSMTESAIALTQSVPQAIFKKVYFPDMKREGAIPFSASVVIEDSALNVYLKPQLPIIDIDGERIQVAAPQQVFRFEKVTSGSYFVSVNDRAYRLSIDESSQVLDTLLLPVGEEIAVSLYEVTPSTFNDLDWKIENEPWLECWYDQEKEHALSRETLVGGGALITILNASGCMSDRVGDFSEVETPPLIEVSYQHRSANELKPHICVSREGDEQGYCYNDPNQPSSKDWQQVHELIPLQRRGDYWIDIIARSFDENESQSIAYKDIQVLTYEVVERLSAREDFWGEWLGEQQFEVRSDSGIIKAYVPRVNAGLIEADDFSDIENCSVDTKGIVLSRDLNDQVVIRAENGGVACKSITTNHKEGGYLFYLEGKNEFGKGLDVGVQERNALYPFSTWLLDEQSFSSVLFYETDNDQASLVDIDAKVWSYANVGTEVSINSAGIYYFPVDWLSRVRVEEVESQNLKAKIQNNLEVLDVRKWGTSHYWAEVRSQEIGGRENVGLMGLSQRYSPGWGAWKIQNPKSKIQKSLAMLMPWIYGEKLEQVKLNGWSNGFLLEESRIKNNESSVILMVYLPQYLEWIGLLMLPLTLGVIVYWPRLRTR